MRRGGVQVKRYVRFLAAAFALALGAGIASAADVVTITAAVRLDQHQAVVEAFNASHPHIRVEIQPVSTDFDQMLVQYAAGTGPDVQFLEWYEQIDRFIDAGVFLPLTPFIERDGMEAEIAEIPAPVRERFSRNGQLYAIPEYLHMRGVGINRQYREEAGLAIPDNNWTWEDFAEYALKLRRTDADGNVTLPGTTINPHWAVIQGWLGGTGVPVHHPDDPTVINLLAPEHVAAFEFLQEISRVHGRYPGIAGGILAGRVAMQDNMASNYAPVMYESPYDFDVAETPVGPGGTRAIVVNDGSFYINKDTPHPEAAWEFLRFFYSPEGQRVYMNATGFQPARLSLVPEWMDIVMTRWKMSPEWFQPFINAYAYAQVTHYFGDSQVLLNYLLPAFEQIINDLAPAAATLEAVIPAANAFLREHQARN